MNCVQSNENSKFEKNYQSHCYRVVDDIKLVFANDIDNGAPHVDQVRY